jgi:hypothetical protein
MSMWGMQMTEIRISSWCFDCAPYKWDVLATVVMWSLTPGLHIICPFHQIKHQSDSVDIFYDIFACIAFVNYK